MDRKKQKTDTPLNKLLMELPPEKANIIEATVKALQESEEKFRRILDNSQAIIFMMDKNGIFNLSEGGGLTALNLKPGEVVGQSAYEIYNDFPDVINAIELALTGTVYKGIIDLESTQFDSFFSPYKNSGGEIDGVIGMAIDITERKKLEAQLLQSKKLEAMGTLAGGIAHEFNNIIAIIMGHAGLLRQELDESHKCLRNIDSIHTAAVRAKVLTEQILAFSRQDKYNPVELNMGDVIEEISCLISESLDKNISVQRNIEPGLRSIHADKVQMHQVLINLCTNSRDAMPRGGQLTITARNVTLDKDFTFGHGSAGEGHYLQLTVSDTGEGIDAKTLERIFDPFFTTREVGSGIGLGLSTVYGIAKRHNGFVTIHSERRKGTTVNVYIPQVESIQ